FVSHWGKYGTSVR
ncbi:hypothetical protein VCHENC02_3422, partial [Vibrio harveyi]